MDRLLIGRKEICQYLGLSWSTVKNWAKRYNLPVVFGAPGASPTLHTRCLYEWEQSRLKAQKRK